MPEQLLIEIRVRPNSSRNKVGGTVGDPPRLVVAVQAPAVDGKANEAPQNPKTPLETVYVSKYISIFFEV